MRALTADGPRESPRLRDLPAPEPGPGQLLVAVRSSAVTGADVAVAEGRLLDDERTFPHGLGHSYAGVVEAVGSGVEGFATGARVLGVVLGTTGDAGAWAERLVVPADDRVAPIPDGVDDAAAGAVGLLGTVAMNLVSAVRAGDGRSVLVDGDVLGLAPLVVALAAARGAEVLATGTGADVEVLRAQGATEVLDPGDDVVAAVRAARPGGVHALIDLVDRGHDAFKAALDVLEEGGYAVSAFGAATGSGRPDVDVTNVFVEPGPGQLAELAGLVADGRLPVPVALTVDLEGVGEQLRPGHDRPLGAVVVTVSAG